MSKKQRNSPERTEMLGARRLDRRSRGPASSLRGVPASINRRTGQPHLHLREKARRLSAVRR